MYGVYAVWCCIAVCSYSAVWRCMAVWRRGGGVTRRVRCMEQYSCMVSCMVFLLYSTKWRTETHADSVPVGEDGVTEGVGRYPAPMAACTAAWAHPGHAPLPRHARQGCMAGCMEFGCISLYFAVCRSIQRTRLVTPPPRRHTAIQRHTAPYSAIQRCMSIQLYSTIQHTAHTTPLR